MENLWVKIAAVILAILLWFHVVTEKEYQYDYYLPLVAVDITGELVLTEKPPDSINVSVLATGKNLLRTDWKKRGLKLVANRSIPGKFKVDLTSSNMTLVKAEEVALIEVLEPREIILSCDRYAIKDVPVRSRIIIDTDKGYAVDILDSLIPRNVSVSGPKYKIDTLRFIETEETAFGGVRNNFSASIPLHYPDIYGIKINPDTIQTFVSVAPVKRKDFEDVVVRMLNGPSGIDYDFSPRKIDLTISGKAELVNNIEINQISVIADYILKNAEGQIPIQVVVPPAITILSKSVDSVKFVFQK